MAERPHLQMIQQQAKELESKKFEREKQDNELVAEEDAELAKLEADFVIEKNDLKADMHALRSHATASADESKFELHETHKKELEALKKKQMQEIDNVDEGKESNLKMLMDAEKKKEADLKKAQEERRSAIKAEILAKKEVLVKRRKGEDDEVMRKWWKVLQDNIGAWANLGPSTQQQSAASSTSVPKGIQHHSLKRQFGTPPPAMPVGWGVWVEPEEGNTKQQEPRSHKRPRLVSAANYDVRDATPPSYGLPDTSLQVLIPKFDALSTIAPSNSVQNLQAWQPPHRSDSSRTHQDPSPPKPLNNKTFNPPTGPRSGRFNQNHSLQVQSQERFSTPIREEPKAAPKQAPKQVPKQSPSQTPKPMSKPAPKPVNKAPPPSPVIKMVPYIDQIPPPRRYFPIKYIATSTAHPSQKITLKSITQEPTFYLYYNSSTSSFHPGHDNKDIIPTCPALALNVKNVHRLDYNVGKALVIVHRRPEKESQEKEGEKGAGNVFIEFVAEDACLVFVNLCKDNFWNIVLNKRAEVGIMDQFKYIGWSEQREL